MLLVNYGNFLTLTEMKNEEYCFRKPIIKLFINGLVLFSFVGLLMAAASFGIAKMDNPTETYNSDKYKKANDLSVALAADLRSLHDARPENINVCRIIQTFLSARPEEVSIANIQIKPEKYVVKGCANTSDIVSEYTSNLIFDNGYSAKLSDVKNKGNITYWTIEVMKKVKGVTKND